MSTDTIARPEVCPDPVEHDDQHRLSETTHRYRAAGREYPAEPGLCPWCDGRRP